MKANIILINNPTILINGIPQIGEINYEIVLSPETAAEEFIFDHLESKNLELTDKYKKISAQQATFTLEFKEKPHE